MKQKGASSLYSGTRQRDKETMGQRPVVEDESKEFCENKIRIREKGKECSVMALETENRPVDWMGTRNLRKQDKNQRDKGKECSVKAL